MHAHTNKSMTVRVGTAGPIVILVLLLFLLCLSSCSFPGLPNTSTSKNTGTQITPIVPQIIAPYQPHKTIDVWLNDTQSYPRQYFNEAKHAIADAIDQAVQANFGGMVAYISIITSNSWKPESTLLTITIPAIPADPPTPVLQPQPTPTGDPYRDAANAGAVDAANAQTLAAYQQVLEEHHSILAKVQVQVRRLTDQLRTLNPPIDQGQPDLWGVLERTSQRLNSGESDRMLLIVSSLDSTIWSQFTPYKTIWGVTVRILWWYCQNAAACNDAFWRGAFTHAGAVDVRLDDPAQSATLQNILS